MTQLGQIPLTEDIAGSNAVLPPGVVVPFAGTVEPTGWLLCDGRAVSRATYAALFTALGSGTSPYGQGDGSTTFNLPDLRGRSPLGASDFDTAAGNASGNSRAQVSRGAAGGEQNHAITTSEMPSHSHGDGTLQAVTPSGRSFITSGGGTIHGQGGDQWEALGAVDVSGSTGSAGSSASHNNLAPYQAVLFLIKY